jgi:hypothetical protein
LKGLAEAGEIGPDDLVWNSSLTEWVPAQKVKGLVFATTSMDALTAAPPAAIAPQASTTTLAYESRGPSEGVQMTLRAVDLLSRTRTWVLIVALAMFFEALLLVVRGFGMLVIGTSPSGRGNTVIITYSLTTVAIGVFLGVPTIYLMRYYAHIGNLKRLRRPADLENALNAQRAYWKFLAIATLVLVGLVVVAIVIAVLGGVAGWF